MKSSGSWHKAALNTSLQHPDPLSSTYIPLISNHHLYVSQARHSGEHSVNQFMQLNPCYRSVRFQYWHAPSLFLPYPSYTINISSTPSFISTVHITYPVLNHTSTPPFSTSTCHMFHLLVFHLISYNWTRPSQVFHPI